MKKFLLILLCIVNCALCININAQEKEFRASWVATVWNIDWPTTQISKAGNATQIAAQKAELVTIIERAKQGNLNAIMLQVRSHGDALYESSYEPWMSSLTGSRGTDPGYDPLAFAIEEAHKRGIELHAWINPYRIGEYSLNAPQVKDSWRIGSGSTAFLDPGNPDVRKYTLDVITEIITKYDIDGIIFDDYFYKSMPDNTYAANETKQTAENNPYDLDINDWRRENVNILVKSVLDSVKAHKPYLRFGIGPFGIYSTRTRTVYNESHTSYDKITPASGISGQDAYSVLYCDAAAWLKRGYIDYISPQLYWPSLSSSPKYSSGQDYETLCEWWSELADKYKRPLFTSNDVAKNSNGRFNPPADITNQINVNRTDNKAKGTIFYNNTYWQNRNGANTYFDSNDEGYHTYLPENHFQNIALWPAITWRRAPSAPEISNLSLNENQHILTWNCSKENYRFAIYCYDKELTQSQGCKPENLLGITYTPEFNTLQYNDLYSDKTWNVKIVDRYGNVYTGARITPNEQQEDTTTAITTPQIDQLLPIYNTPNGIRIELEKRSKITIYNISGQIIYKKTTNGDININLSKGIYIVQINNKKQKITI